jgi:hypothetical protein
MDPTTEPNKPVETTPQVQPVVQSQTQPLSPQPQAATQIKIEEKNVEANAQYAEALINMVNYDYSKQHPKEAKHSRTISNKQMFVVVILILLTVLGTLIYEQFNNSASSTTKSASSSDSSKSSQLLKSAETFGNPSSY